MDKAYFDGVLHRRLSPIRLRKSIYTLSRMLHEHHGRRVIMLFDEYDNPMLNAYGKEFHGDVVQFMRDIMASVLKGNESLMFGVITGVMQIAKEGIFSGLNNITVNNVLSIRFDGTFGFTGEEVRAICGEYGREVRRGQGKVRRVQVR